MLILKNWKLFKESINTLTKNLTIKKDIVSSTSSQKLLHKYVNELQVFRNMIKKGMDKTGRDILFYYSNDIFIGFLIYNENHQIFNENKERVDDGKSFYNTINIADVEVLESIRGNKNTHRFGTIILKKFIQDNESKYDGITLQAQNDFLLNKYYPKYEFVDLKSGGNAMVRWSK